MASQDVLDDFLGASEGLSTTVPGTLTGLTTAEWVAIDQSGSPTSAFVRTSSGTTAVMPAAGQARYARLDMDTLVHSAGVTTFEASIAPGGQLRVNLDFGTRFLSVECGADGSGNWMWNQPPSTVNGSFTGTAPGAFVVLRIEVTSTATRYYVDNVLKYTHGSGIPYSAVVNSVRLGYPRVFAAHGYSTGATVLALKRFEAKTETTTGPLDAGVTQPAPTASSDIKVLFSDAFSTALSLNNSHGEEGPLGGLLWQCTEYLEGLPPQAEANPHWTRGDPGGLTVKKFARVPDEVALNAACFTGSDAARMTKLPIVLAVVVPAGFTGFTALFSVAAGPTTPFAQASFKVSTDGSVLLSWISGGAPDAQRETLGFVFAPTTIGGGGLPLRMELWPTHIRLYANGALTGVMKDVDTGYLTQTAEQVELLTWALAIDHPDDFSTTPRPVVQKLTVSGREDSSGALPDEGGSLRPFGPGNEPDPTNPFADFWTKFNATYEVP